MNTVQQIGRGLLDVVFPPVCVQCEALVEGSGYRHLCAKCAPLLHLVHAPHCSTCGHPFYGEMQGERMCPHCQGLAPAFREGRTAVMLKGPARALVHTLKYHRGLHVLGDMVAIIAQNESLVSWLRDAVLVPVPLHSRRERERGYNQSRLIAESVARLAGGTTRVEDLLIRDVDTVSQTHHDKKTRQANLKNAFALAQGVTINTAQHTILIDDVFTTGSTLNSCARTLRRAGCLNLDVFTFGHG